MSSVIDTAGLHVGTETVEWERITAVGLRTTADGPYAEDVFWQFLLRDGFVELPGSGVTGDAVEVLHRNLPGLDSMKVVMAMGSSDERIFRIWHVDESLHRWTDETGRSRFDSLVARLGGDTSAAGAAFERLHRAWSGPERRYHTLEHLAECLHLLDRCGVSGLESAVAELALWFHDAVYAVPAHDNEERSARLLLEQGATLGVPAERLAEAADLVRATAHLDGGSAATPLAQLFVDIDLAILGSDVLRFMDFEYSVEEEYAAVAGLPFRIRRGAFLGGLLRRESLFRTAYFREHREARARANLEALLSSPRYRVYRWLRPLLPRRSVA